MLQVIDVDTIKSPLMMETPLDPALDGPYLVSSSKSLLWVERKFPGNFLRAAVREVPCYSTHYKNIYFKCLKESMKRGWGSALPFTENGLAGVLLYLSSFGFSEFDLVVSPSQDNDFDIPDNVYLSERSWVPQGFCLLSPTDKSYVGSLYRFSNGSSATFVHNPSRGFGFLHPSNLSLEDL